MNKEKILQTIYQQFDNWEHHISEACTKGCASCCTQNVVITATEAKNILLYIEENGLEEWFAEKLKKNITPTTPTLTTNEYAQACLQQTPLEPDPEPSLRPCPFLENNCCTIYEIRPFSCRCFSSKRTCSTTQPAEIPEYYLSGATAVQQLIEHLDQGDYWGNMLDVLLAMCSLFDHRAIGNLLPTDTLTEEAKTRLKWSKPLPGFLLTEEDVGKVSPLLESIFDATVDNKTIKQILNGQ